ncbi:MAG: pur operon repressor [Peptostreptococcaceae bacterium]|nr:pur operon repressor [Peptostreptococcaceae bacterium]
MKFRKSERIGAIVKILSDNPNKIYTLGYFTELFSTAKSTLSEDIAVVKNVFEKLELGKIITIAGAAGGMKFIPYITKDRAIEEIQKLITLITDDERKLVGGFLYLNDLVSSPNVAKVVGDLFASVIDYKEADCVVTIEAKGIPIGVMTAKAMNLPLVVVRKNARITEGPSLAINYMSSTSGKIQSMTLPRRSIKRGSKVILVDDFMRAGGTFKGMEDLMREFDAKVIAKAVFVELQTPKKEMSDYFSLMTLKDTQEIDIEISRNFLERF